MKLDPRIENESLIYTPFSNAHANLHEHGYFAGDMKAFSNLDNCKYGELVDYNLDLDYPYWRRADLNRYAFYIPESSLKSAESNLKTVEEENKNKSLTLDEVKSMCEECMKEIRSIKTELNSVKTQLQLNVEWLNRTLGISK